MVLEKRGFLAVFLFFAMIFLGGIIVDAESCYFTDRGNCNSPNVIIIGISGQTNAHGEVWNGTGIYDYVICCDYVGSRTCDGTNTLIKLSSSTNAHAEIKYENNYLSNEICYENLSCENMADCTADYPLEIFSLSAITNAHIAEYNTSGYDIDICCNISVSSSCVPNCSGGKICGSDGCTPNGCGECNDNIKCTTDSCAANQKSCIFTSKVCNDNDLCTINGRCNNNTGNCLFTQKKCPANQTCNPNNGECKTTCNPDCSGKACGDDGCGGSCGPCESWEYCDEDVTFTCLSDTSCQLVYISWDKNYTFAEQEVFLQVMGSSNCSGENVSFDVWEQDPIVNDDVITEPNNAQFNSSGWAVGNWIAEFQGDGAFGDLPEYRFKATVEGISISADSGLGGGIQELQVNTTSCNGIVSCVDYTSELECNDNACQGFLTDIINNSAILANLSGKQQQCGFLECNPPLTNSWFDNCNCVWDEEDGCGFKAVEKICGGDDENLSLGWCNQQTESVKGCDEPPEGLYTFSWTGYLVWLQTGWANQTDCINDMGAPPADCILDSGKWYYYPGGDTSWCGDGETTIECPEEVRLPFFGVNEFIITLIVIGAVYTLIIFRRKVR